MKRPDAVAWYRNPPRASQDSLGIVYEDGAVTRIVRPDFIFFSKKSDSTTVADIVDPHGTHFGDSLPKLKGLAAFAQANAALVRRVEAVAVVGDKNRLLDLTVKKVRDAVGGAKSARDPFASDLATEFVS